MAKVTVLELEKYPPRKQCHAFATHDVIFAMHGSSLGNLICVTPASVVIEVFPSGFHLDFFALFAAVLDVTLLQVTDGKNTTFMSRGNFRSPQPWGPSQHMARECESFQPESHDVTKALRYAAAVPRQASHGAETPPTARALPLTGYPASPSARCHALSI